MAQRIIYPLEIRPSFLGQKYLNKYTFEPRVACDRTNHHFKYTFEPRVARDRTSNIRHDMT